MRHPEANRHQRARRASNPRVDYYPGREALEIFQARKAEERPGSVAGTNSAVLDAILLEWADLTGINNQSKSNPMTPAKRPELIHPYARASDFGGIPARLLLPENKAKQRCGAKTKAGHPCRSKAEPGKQRCKWHGGRSTGPRTAEGKARALGNLRKFAKRDEVPAGSIA